MLVRGLSSHCLSLLLPMVVFVWFKIEYTELCIVGVESVRK